MAALSGLADEPWAHHLQFNHLDSNQGLSNNAISGLAQDAAGFLWIGTEDGLDRFDGYGLRTYRFRPHDPQSLMHNLVTALHVDREGRLWIGTQGGVNRYVPSTDAFVGYRPGGGLNVPLPIYRTRVFFEDGAGSLFAATEMGFVFRFDEAADRFVPLHEEPLGIIKAAAFGPAGRLWVGSDEGLILLDPSSGAVLQRLGAADLLASSTPFVHALARGPEGRMWVGTMEEGLRIVDPETLTCQLRQPRGPDDEANFYFIHAIREDARGNYWVGHDYGLSIYDPVRDRFVTYRNAATGRRSLDASIHAIHFDRDGMAWLGSSDRGLFSTHANHPFRNLQFAADDTSGLRRRSVSAVAEDRLGRLWVGFYQGGIDVFDQDRRRIATLDPGEAHRSDYGAGTVFAFHEDRDGRMWVGTYRGGVKVYRPDFSLAEERVRDLHQPDHGLAGNDVRAIAEDSRGRVWFLCHGEGLSRWDPSTGRYTHFRHDRERPHEGLLSDWGFSLVVDKRDDVWIGSDAGLNRWRSAEQRFERFEAGPDARWDLRDPIVNTLYVAANQDIWIGTRSGLQRFDRESGEIAPVDPADGFPSRNISGIVEDGRGNLWCSTDKGIVKISLERGRFQAFDSGDGLQDNEFATNAVFRSRDGKLIFGGVNGVTSFRPEQVRLNLNPPNVVLTELLLYNRPVGIGAVHDDRVILPAALSELSSITLRANEDFFTLRFAALNFHVPEKNEYAYMLEGFDEDWIEVGNKREATYTNLNPGTYRFRVVASNNDGVWNRIGAGLEVRILPAFWQTWWFRVAVVAAFLGLLLAGYWWRIRLVRRNEARLFEMVAERTRALQAAQQELAAHKENLEQVVEERTMALVEAKVRAEQSDRAKTAFLANMSHEIRTPMNAILGYAQLMSRDGGLSEEQRSSLEVIHRSGEHLLSLINDVLEMSKIEAGRVHLHPRVFDLRAMLQDLESMFRVPAREKGLELGFTLPPTLPRELELDDAKLRQILINLVGNAVKFTAKGRVEVICHLFAERREKGAPHSRVRLIFEVRDTGPGIESDFLEDIFRTFTQSVQGEQNGGTGLGLAISREHARLLGGDIRVRSTPGKGSCFTVEVFARRAAGLTHPPLPSNQEVVGLKQPSKAPRILVVDDRRSNREILVKMLARLGFPVLEAVDGIDALEQVAAHHPRIVLMDIQMPRMGGKEAIRRLREDEEGRSLCIIAVTAGAFLDEQDQILASGADAFLSKPFKERTILGLIHQHAGVEFLYEGDEAEAATGADADCGGPFDAWAARLRELPDDFAERFSAAVHHGSLCDIRALATEVRRSDPELCEVLLGYLDRFDIRSLGRLAGLQRI